MTKTVCRGQAESELLSAGSWGDCAEGGGGERRVGNRTVVTAMALMVLRETKTNNLILGSSSECAGGT